MNFNNVEFLISAASTKDFPGNRLPEIAFAGKSNVGKSSVINRILQRKNFARVGEKPGKTIHVNYFVIDKTCYFVDLPGYGYASRSKAEIKKWGDMIETYLNGREQLYQVFLLVDSRHKPTDQDKMMLRWIRACQENVVVIATKTDKISKKQLEENLEMINETLSLTDDDLLVPFSTKNDEGKFTIWDIINLLRTNDGEY